MCYWAPHVKQSVLRAVQRWQAILAEWVSAIEQAVAEEPPDETTAQ
jgi:hypothetical protein